MDSDQEVLQAGALPSVPGSSVEVDNLTPSEIAKPSRPPETVYGDAADTFLKAQTLLSALTLDQTRPRTAHDALLRPLELPEMERQRRHESDLHLRIVTQRKSLVDLGETHGIRYITYEGEHHLKQIMELITKDLSEPYSIYTYRYFIYQWPKLCFLAVDLDGKVVGAIVCKMENTKGPLGRNDTVRRGYIAMLAVDKSQRRKRIGTALVVSAVESLMNNGCDEVVLETETTNQSALKLYENLGFARHKRLLKYYLNGVDAYRLKLWIRYPSVIRERARVSMVEAMQSDMRAPQSSGSSPSFKS